MTGAGMDRFDVLARFLPALDVAGSVTISASMEPGAVVVLIYREKDRTGEPERFCLDGEGCAMVATSLRPRSGWLHTETASAVSAMARGLREGRA